VCVVEEVCRERGHEEGKGKTKSRKTSHCIPIKEIFHLCLKAYLEVAVHHQ
jgi:hypothetical protein